MPPLLPRPVVLASEAYDNVCNCRFTPEAEKRDYLMELCSCGADVTLGKQVHTKRRIGNLRKGPKPADILPDEGLGVLMKRADIVRYLSPKFRLSSTQFADKLELWLSFSSKRARDLSPTDEEIYAAELFLTATIPTRSDGELWLFRNPSRSQDPFDGLHLPQLAWRLGLQTATGEERIGMSFSSNRVEEKSVPRYYDATWDYLPLWSWTGRTRPIAGRCGSSYGLPEILASPPTFREVNFNVNIVVTE